MRSPLRRRVILPVLESRFRLPVRKRPELPAWLTTAFAFAVAGPALFIPGLIFLAAGSEDLARVVQLGEITVVSGLWTLLSWMAGPIVLRRYGYPAVVARRIERRWLRKNATRLARELHENETVLDVAGVHPNTVTDGSPMAIYVLTDRRISIVRTAQLWPFGRKLPVSRTLSIGAVGSVLARQAGLLKRVGTLFDAGRGDGVLEIGVLGSPDMRLRFASLEEAKQAEQILREAMVSGATAGAGALGLAETDDASGRLAVAGQIGDAGALSAVPARSGG